jgi:transposase-like protein
VEPVKHKPGESCPACRSVRIVVTADDPRPRGLCLDCRKRWTVGGRRNHRGGAKHKRKRLTRGQGPGTLGESTPTPKEAP